MRRAWGLTASIALTLGLTLCVNYAYNVWNRVFFDAVGQKDATAMWQSLIWLPPVVIIGAGLAALMIWLRQTLQLSWRTFLTAKLLGLWLGEQRYYRLSLAQSAIGNVEHRIAEDVRQSIEPAVDLSVGLAWSITNALMFLGVLIAVGGSATVYGVTIPGYVAIAAVVYAAAVTGGVAWIGRKLANAFAARNESEAQFRYELTRIRENAESIAFLRGDAKELSNATTTFQALRQAWKDVIRQNSNVTWITNGNSFLAPVVPAVLAAPKFITGDLSLGAVMQIVAAFSAVLGALNWLTDNFLRISELRAAARRVGELAIALSDLDADRAASGSIARPGRTPDIEMRGVTVRKEDGTVLIGRTDVLVNPGERILIEGRSGTGKSTLLRSIAGLWPWADGKLKMPAGARMAFVPQRPYIPIGRLVDALTYPSDRTLPREDAARVLARVGLDHLIERLEETAAWDTILSGGERQRIGFARLLLDKPDIIVLDEATSALDDESQAQIFQTLVDELPAATILNVAHRQGLRKFHDRRMVIVKSDDGARVETKSAAGSSLPSMIETLKRGSGGSKGREK